MNGTVYIDFPEHSSGKSRFFDLSVPVPESWQQANIIGLVILVLLLLGSFTAACLTKRAGARVVAVIVTLALLGGVTWQSVRLSTHRPAAAEKVVAAPPADTRSKTEVYESEVRLSWPEFADGLLDLPAAQHADGRWPIPGHPGCDLTVSRPKRENRWAGLVRCNGEVIAPNDSPIAPETPVPDEGTTP